MDTVEHIDKNRILNFFAFFIESLSLYVQSVVRQNNNFLKKVTEDFQIAELFDALSDRFAEHPLLKFLVFSIAYFCTIPIVMFLVFGIASVVVTFAGFLFIEGTLLAVGGLCMFICIMALILVLSMLGVMLGAFYILAIKLKDVLQKIEAHANIFQNSITSGTQEPAT